MTEELIYHKFIDNLNMLHSVNCFKCLKQILTTLKRKIDKYAIMGADFNAPLSKIVRASRSEKKVRT